MYGDSNGAPSTITRARTAARSTIKRRAAIVAVGCWAARPTGAAAPQPGDLVAWPEFTLLDGRRVGAAALRGRAVVAVFFTITCPFCRRHNQHVQQLHRRAGERLFVLGIARESDADAVRRHAREQGYGFPITLDVQPLAAVLSLRRMVPLTACVDRHGRLQQVFPGEMFEADVLELESRLGAA